MASAILALDQGTTGSTALLMSASGSILGRATREFTQHYPEPGWVEHDPEAIWQSIEEAAREALKCAEVRPSDVAAIGITNQRETVILWDRASGRPIHRAIVWQDRRTADRCQALRAQGHEAQVRNVTGLVIDPYFSATKIEWILDHVPGARQRAEHGDLAFGTVDSYLVWRLTGGDRHVTDVTNAARTLLFDLRTLAWDRELCGLFRVPPALLPEVLPCAGDFGRVRGFAGLPDGLPISGVAGDQQAATFGQGCFQPGDVKCTYGTGAFVVVNTGSTLTGSRHGLLCTLAWQIGSDVHYALEGSCFIAGAAVQWLRDGLGIIERAADVEALARAVPDSGGVAFVPALVGLGAPHWDAEARGLICGITRGTTKAHIARATLESIAFQVDDLVRAMTEDLGAPLSRLRVDGGAARNDLLMQFQSDISALEVDRPSELETTARGAAMLAGIGARIFRSGEDAAQMIQMRDRFSPAMVEAERQSHRARWLAALRRTRLGSRQSQIADPELQNTEQGRA